MRIPAVDGHTHFRIWDPTNKYIFRTRYPFQKPEGGAQGILYITYQRPTLCRELRSEYALILPQERAQVTCPDCMVFKDWWLENGAKVSARVPHLVRDPLMSIISWGQRRWEEDKETLYPRPGFKSLGPSWAQLVESYKIIDRGT